MAPIEGEVNNSQDKQKEIVSGYLTADEAAKAALDIANPISISENREYGGLIYKDPSTGSYFFTAAVRGSEDGVNPYSSPAPVGMEVVGDYHTHGNYSIRDPATGKIIATGDPENDVFDSDNFSTTDKIGITHDAWGKSEYKGYLGTPSGVYRVYDPKTKSDKVLEL